MRVQIIDIGNSKGVRIPQAILKQAAFAKEVEMDVAEGKITLRRVKDATIVPNFASFATMDDETIQRVLRKISGTDLITALIDAAPDIKQAIYRNLSDRVRDYLVPTVERLEKGDARDILIERSRNALSEAFMELLNE
jgi:antitoxin component of MazEF toxin-antitoxin module